jgi:polar amino acid transport system substrate-binding protein
LKSATLVRTKDNQSSIDAFKNGGAEALAGLKPAMLDAMPQLPDARMLEGKFMTVNHGLGTPRDRGAAAEYLKAFVADVNASGFVAKSIERHRVQGLSAVK